MNLTINESGVFLNGKEIPQCTQVDLKNISPVEGMEAVLHIHVNEADVHWKVKPQPTEQLVQELRGRDGVNEVVFQPYEKASVEVEGPATVLVVTD